MQQKKRLLSPALRYLRPYKSAAVANIVYNVLATFFAIISFVVLKPFLDILFLDNAAIAAAPIGNTVASGWLSAIIADFNLFLRQYIANHSRHAGLVLVCVIILCTFLLKNLFRYLALFAMSPARNGIERDLRQQILDKLLYLPLAFFTNERKGDLMARFGTDVQEIQFSILRSLETFVRAPIAIIGSLVVMIYISPTLTLFSFLLMLVVGLLIGRLGKSLKRNSAEAQNLLGRLFNILEETLGGMRILRAFGAEDYQSRHFSQLNGQHYDLQTRIQRRKDLSSPLTEFLGIAIIAILLLFGGHLVFQGYFEPSTFVVFIMMFYNIIEPAKSFSSAFYDIQRGTAAAERIADILNQELINPIETPNKTLLQHLPPTLDIEYKNVSFAYPNTEQQVLHQLSWRIPFGKTVAIVGTSGSGKSTLVDLLPRFYEPSEGEILLGEHNIKDFDIRMLRACFGIVSQDPVLFNDTVANNIALGLANTPREDIIKAAQLAAAHDFISALPDGYDSNIGERGGKLSGGQRQRIALARAILRRPPVLILDEATSALDSESEKLIQDALAELRQNRTVIIIAHRFSTIQAADQIIVMQDGAIVESGTHQELLQRGGEYHKFHGLQSLH